MSRCSNSIEQENPQIEHREWRRREKRQVREGAIGYNPINTMFEYDAKTSAKGGLEADASRTPCSR